MNTYDYPTNAGDLAAALSTGAALVLPGALIAGSFESGKGAQQIVLNPATGGAIAEFNAAAAAQVERAVQAAQQALPAWKARNRLERARVLRAIADRIEEAHDTLAALQVANNGKPAGEAEVDVLDVINVFRYYGDLCAGMKNLQSDELDIGVSGYHAQMNYEAVGVAGLIVPWNFPMVTTAWKVAAALAAGCTIVLKPSELTPVAELALAGLIHEAGLPPGVLNLVFGAADTGRALVQHPGVAKVSFTGSTAVGAAVMRDCADRMARVSLELGGKSALIVCADANLQLAVDLAIGGAFCNAGQMCSATSRILVHDSVYTDFILRMKEAIANLKVGGPQHGGANMGPVISARQQDKVLSYIAQARADGLRPVAEGSLPDDASHGYYVAPHLYADVPRSHPLWNEEIFGPIACVRRFATNDEAVHVANDSEYGLVATVVTEDSAAAAAMSEALQTGLVWINTPQIIFPGTSWGGFKRSGIGRELGVAGVRAYQEMKQVLKNA
ncbi:aldehyde dehydrogenase family protein [Duganella sp. FT80W]|uniref:aldehyde dehydrogenase (NAD(+)) n=1 Tax=Duganella guangzhouensis TaxID=2666084 RepID=A0A6I2L1P3_9BURK|nr:aldehyde dehydrogenase family protein [Duganella guangzhouensis]MRW91793.1 aldehyde dehydrogenase family protein [Duganella guangzhouensis]